MRTRTKSGIQRKAEWVDSMGGVRRIGEMDDSHLINVVQFLLKKPFEDFRIHLGKWLILLEEMDDRGFGISGMTTFFRDGEEKKEVIPWTGQEFDEDDRLGGECRYSDPDVRTGVLR